MVVLKDGKLIRGTLTGHDQFMNLTLKGAKLFGNIPLKPRESDPVVIRGDSILAVYPVRR